MWFIYMVRCSDNSLYTGVTTDIGRRLREHNGEIIRGAKYTRLRRPVTLVFAEPAENRRAATTREHAIKKLSRQEKERLIQDQK